MGSGMPSSQMIDFSLTGASIHKAAFIWLFFSFFSIMIPYVGELGTPISPYGKAFLAFPQKVKCAQNDKILWTPSIGFLLLSEPI